MTRIRISNQLDFIFPRLDSRCHCPIVQLHCVAIVGAADNDNCRCVRTMVSDLPSQAKLTCKCPVLAEFLPLPISPLDWTVCKPAARRQLSGEMFVQYSLLTSGHYCCCITHELNKMTTQHEWKGQSCSISRFFSSKIPANLTLQSTPPTISFPFCLVFHPKWIIVDFDF